MGGYKIGSYSYPSLKFERALEINKMICDPPYQGQLSQSGLAQALKGMSETGGAFINLVGSMRDYGLVQGKGTLVATDLAKRIVAGTAEESAKAKAEAFLNVPLFKQIYQRIGINIPPEEQFSVLLGEITQEDKLKLQKRSKNVLNFYMEGARYLRPTEGGTELENITGPTAKPTTSLEEIKIGGDIKVWLPKEGIKEAWNKTKRIVDIYLEIDKKGEK
jgi:hypothetical protein